VNNGRFGRRLAISLFGLSAWITRPEDVVLYKLHWNLITPPDRQTKDVSGILKVSGDMIDLEYLSHWASIIGISETLGELMKEK
jgi:hypothetical protein